MNTKRLLLTPKKLQNIPDFYSNCFAKEKSSSIFARTFAKAGCAVNFEKNY